MGPDLGLYDSLKEIKILPRESTCSTLLFILTIYCQPTKLGDEILKLDVAGTNGCLTESTRIASCGPSMPEVTFTVSNQLSGLSPLQEGVRKAEIRSKVRWCTEPDHKSGSGSAFGVRTRQKSENRCWTYYSSSNLFCEHRANIFRKELQSPM